MRDLFTRSPDIPGPLRSPHDKISWKDFDQDPTRRKYREGCADEIKIGTALQRERSDTHKPRRGLREPKQNMPQAGRQRHSVSKMSTALQPERSDTRKVERVAFANIKSAPRHSETQKITVPTAPWRQKYNTKCDFSMFCDASTAPATKKMSPRHTKSCNCHAKWCQHSRSKFDDSFTKRAFRALQDRLQEHQILRLPRKMTIFHHLQLRATLTTILHTPQNPHVLHISGFPKIDTARRRECASEIHLVKNTFRAGEMHFFDLDHNFSPRGSTNLPHTDAHTTDLHQMLFYYRKNPIVWPHCLGNNNFGDM